MWPMIQYLVHSPLAKVAKDPLNLYDFISHYSVYSGLEAYVYTQLFYGSAKVFQLCWGPEFVWAIAP